MQTYNVWTNGSYIGQIEAMNTQHAASRAESKFGDRWTKAQIKTMVPSARVNVTIENIPPPFSPVRAWIKAESAATALRLVRELKGDDEFREAVGIILGD